MPQTNKHFWQKLTVLAVLSGLIYNSWPLGYWLNPPVAKAGLASALEAQHQPYSWLFIVGDVLSSLLIILVCWLVWQRRLVKRPNRLLAAVLINVVIFGLGTIVDTLLPEHCLPEAPACPSWRHDHLLLAHGVFSILASFCLFLSLVFIWWRHRIALLNVLIVGYLLFGIFTLVEALTPAGGNWSQHYYIVLCGVWLALIPYTIRRAFPEQPLAAKKS